MRLRLNTTLRAALIAAISTFALATTAFAAETGTQTFGAGTPPVLTRGQTIFDDGWYVTKNMTAGTASANLMSTLSDTVNISNGAQDFRATDYTVSIWVSKESLQSNRLIFAYGGTGTQSNDYGANGIYWDASAQTLKFGRGKVNNDFTDLTWKDNMTSGTLTLGDYDMVNFTIAVSSATQSETPTVWVNGVQQWTAASSYAGNMNASKTPMNLYVGSGVTYGNVSITNEKLTEQSAILTLMGLSTEEPPASINYVWKGTVSAVWDATIENWEANGAPTTYVASDVNTVTFDSTGSETEVTLDITTTIGSVTVTGAGYTLDLNNNTLTTGTLTIADGASLTATGAGIMEVSGVVSAAGANALIIGEDATLKITNADAAKALMKNSSVANNGTLELGADVTIGTTADSSTIGGTLLIKGHTLSLGNAEGQEASIHSFSSIQLDNGIISFNNKQDNLQNLGVAKDKTGVISVYDMGQDGAALVLDGTTNINGTLTIQNEWNAQFDIKKLAGSGTLNIKGTNGAESSRQAATYTIGSVEGGFAGTVNIINSSATVKLADGAKLGSMEIGPGSLLVDTGVTATIGNLKVRDNRDATITVNGALNVTQMVTIGALKTLSINSTQDGGAKTLTTTTLGFDNVDAKISLQGVKLVVNDAATAGTIDPHNTNRGLMTVGSGASLELNGGVQWNTSDSKCADLVIENGGAVSVAAGTGNKIRNITLNASGGAITFSNSTNTVASLSVAAPAQGATTSVTIASDATLTINGGSLSNAITNNGTLVFGGDITASGLTVNKGSSGLIDVNDKTDSGNGFETTSGDYITIVNNGTEATLTPAGHKVTQDSVEYTIQADGTAVAAGGTTDYMNYYQTNGEVATSAITAYATDHGKFCMYAYVSDTGVLNVDNAMAFIGADGGTVNFVEGADVMYLTVVNDAVVSGLKDYSIMQIEAGKTATMTDGITAGDVVFSSEEGGVKVTNTNAGEDADITYSIDETAAQVTAETMTVVGTEEVVVSNSLVVGEIVNNNAEGLLLLGNVADGVTLTAADGYITLAGQTTNTLSVVDLTIAAGKTVELIDGDLTEGTITVTDTLTGGSATLLANLTLVGGAKLDVNGGHVAGGDMNALTLGSMLTFDFSENQLVNLDDVTIAALNQLAEGQYLDLIVAAEGTQLDYAGAQTGMNYDDLFSRVGGVEGIYTVYAHGDAFGLVKGSQVPEPTTGTLSLLALAALAARRRRK